MLRIGVIGCGGMGRDHIRRLMGTIPNCTVVGCADYLMEVAQKVADQYGIIAFQTGEELIASKDVDAVVIASIDSTHKHYILEALKYEKYVFCEKPLSETIEDCEEVIAAETKIGKRLVQIGFMRRYDRGYAEMKRIISSGELGAPLIVHAAHRNVTQNDDYTTEMAIANTAVHEFDVIRWLLEDEYTSGQVLKVRQSSCSPITRFENPQLVLLETASGARIDVEVQLADGYAYDIQCQVVCEKGTINLPDPYAVTIRSNATRSTPLLKNWTNRFIEAYDIEFTQWVQSVIDDKITGPSSWDGYAACITADAVNRSRGSNQFFPIEMIAKPDLYK